MVSKCQNNEYKYAVFILTNRRANNIITTKTLRDCGYTGKIYYIVDDEDPQLNIYKENYGDDVIVFSKNQLIDKFDIMDNFDGNNVVVYARNVCFDIAKKLNLDYFLEFEDDYCYFEIRENENGVLKSYKIKDLDSVFTAMIEFLNSSKSITTVAFAQGGDLIGGAEASFFKSKLRRKAMNSFFCSVDKYFEFKGRFNDDVNTYVSLGSIGEVFLTLTNIDLVQAQTQKNKGGNSDSYNKYGTYVKSFYSVMMCPSCICINTVGAYHPRIHHLIDWEKAVPKIISDKFRK